MIGIKSIWILTAIIVAIISSSRGAKSGNGKPKIAIIGGGIGGTSCAYFLRELLGDLVEIDLFERSPILGGRLATIDFADRRYEAGGSIIHKRNRYMADFVKSFGLKKREYSDSDSNDLTGLFDGHVYVFRESSWSFITILKFLWRYGFDVLRLDSTLDDMLAKFDRIYEHQNRARAYSTVGKLLESMSPDFSKNVAKNLRTYLREEGFSDRFANELANAAVRVNYGQNLNVTGFVGTVALAGAQKGLWSVKSGNRLVPENLFNHSRATLNRCDVRKITKSTADNLFSITCLTDKYQEEEYADYDSVIMAMPLIDNAIDIDFENIDFPMHDYSGPYHRLFATFVHGRLNRSAFGECDLKKSILSIFADPCPSEILVCTPDRFWFNSIGALRDVDFEKSTSKIDQSESDQSIYKVFSEEELDENRLKRLFDQVIEYQSIDWLAYPQYQDRIDDVSRKVENLKFEVIDNLYHINIIEWAASAMEMSVIGSKNVAWLVYDRLTRTYDFELEDKKLVKIDLEESIGKSEL